MISCALLPGEPDQRRLRSPGPTEARRPPDRQGMMCPSRSWPGPA